VVLWWWWTDGGASDTMLLQREISRSRSLGASASEAPPVLEELRYHEAGTWSTVAIEVFIVCWWWVGACLELYQCIGMLA